MAGLDISQNNLSNKQISTPSGVVAPELHAATQSIDVMSAYITDATKVENPWTNEQVARATKNDMLYALRLMWERGEFIFTVSLSLDPDTIEVAGTSQATVIATYGTGVTVDVTSEATYSSDTPAVATVSTSGLVTGVDTGTADITATWNGESDTATITVSS